MPSGIPRGHTTGEARDREFGNRRETFCHFLDAQILRNVEDHYIPLHMLFQKLIHYKNLSNYFEMNL